MSHFSNIAVKFKDKPCLVEALQRFGFYPSIHDKPVHLYGYRGDKREQTAHIVVPRNQISSLSNDLGFFLERYWIRVPDQRIRPRCRFGKSLSRTGAEFPSQTATGVHQSVPAKDCDANGRWGSGNRHEWFGHYCSCNTANSNNSDN